MSAAEKESMDTENIRGWLGPRPAFHGNSFDGKPVELSKVNLIGKLHEALDEIDRLREAPQEPKG